MAKKKSKDKMSKKDMEYIINEQEKLREKLLDNKSLERFSSDLMLFVSLIKDYYQGHYRDVPYKTLSAGAVGLLYVLNPIDIIPDSIPIIGYIDDALVVKFCLKLIAKDLKKYDAWKQAQEQESPKDNEKASES